MKTLRGGAVSLIIADDLNTIILPDSNARVGCAEVDTDAWSCVTKTKPEQNNMEKKEPREENATRFLRWLWP
jgi:hypothetical protein